MFKYTAKCHINKYHYKYTTVPFSRACSVKFKENVFRISSGEEIHTPSLHAPEKNIKQIEEKNKSLDEIMHMCALHGMPVVIFKLEGNFFQGNLSCKPSIYIFSVYNLRLISCGTRVTSHQFGAASCRCRL